MTFMLRLMSNCFFFMICRTMVGNDSSFMYFILYVAYSKVLLLIYTVLLFNKNLF